VVTWWASHTLDAAMGVVAMAVAVVVGFVVAQL
jgi:hypothetical protein